MRRVETIIWGMFVLWKCFWLVLAPFSLLGSPFISSLAHLYTEIACSPPLHHHTHLCYPFFTHCEPWAPAGRVICSFWYGTCLLMALYLYLLPLSPSLGCTHWTLILLHSPFFDKQCRKSQVLEYFQQSTNKYCICFWIMSVFPSAWRTGARQGICLFRRLQKLTKNHCWCPCLIKE